MAKEGVIDWDTFCQERIKQYSPPYTMFYRRYHLRTMWQKSHESLRQYSTKFQEYAVKTGIANNHELVFNYLCSLHRRYRKRSWSLVHNHYGEEIPEELQPIVQLVMTLSSGERAPEDEELPMSDTSSDSDSGSETSDSDSHRHKRRRLTRKGKGKAKAKKNKGGNCPIHRGAGHDEENSNVLKKHVNAALSQQASSQASGSRATTFTPRFSRYPNRMPPPPRPGSNLCWHCNKVPFVPGRECQEMRQSRARRAQRLNNNTVRARMAHVNNNGNANLMQIDDEQLDQQAQGKHTSTAPNDMHTHSILVPITIQNRQVKALLDTGADRSLIGMNFAKENKWNITPHTNTGSVIMTMKGDTGHRYGCIKDVPLQYMNRQYQHTFEVLPLAENIKVTIGLDLMPKLGISIHGLATQWNIDERQHKASDDTLFDIPKPNESPAGTQAEQENFHAAIKPDINANAQIPQTSFCNVPQSVVRLETPDNVTSYRPQYALPEAAMDEVKKTIDVWLADGTIERAPTFSAWNSPLTLAQKMDAAGEKVKLRLCRDPRHINQLLPDHG